jgi:hypothetical protein
MKTQNTFIALALFITAFTFGQNTFPTTGNVGIGTTTPNSKLTIRSATTGVSIHPGTNPYFGTLAFNRESGTGQIFDPNGQAFQINNGGTDKNLHFQVYNGNGSTITNEALVISGTNGNIGMGTSNPGAKLDIFGGNATSTNLILSANYLDRYRWRFNTLDRGNAIDLDFTASDNLDAQEQVLKLSRSNSGRPEFQLYNNVIVANDGNVGVGTPAPSAKLDVNGDAIFDFASYNHSSVRFGHDGNDRIIADNSPNKIYGGGYWFRVHNETAGAGKYIDVMALSEAGNVGIGTTNPDAKLTVNGDIHTKEVKIDLSGAFAVPDYVFANDYKLKTLSEVDQYVKANSHLPEIPSAKEMAQNGMLVSEMNLSLLKKIEELTLYAIEQQKKLEAMSERLSKLEKK